LDAFQGGNKHGVMQGNPVWGKITQGIGGIEYKVFSLIKFSHFGGCELVVLG
jgi:hypothetical protein